MIGLVLASALAAADPDVSALDERLLGPPPVVQQALEQPIEPPSMPWWPVPAAAVGIGLLLWVRKTATGALVEDTPITVIGRVPIERGAGLALIEVLDSDGRPRRLLIGLGNGQPPRLVSELGVVGEAFHEALDGAVDESERAAENLLDNVLAQIKVSN